MAVAVVRNETTSRRSLRLKAAGAVVAALRHGKLPRLDGSIACTECKQKPAVHYHHDSYFRPLDVRPVCRSCNGRLGPAEPAWLPAEVDGAIGERRDDERQRTLEDLVDRCETQQQIAEALGVTRERARQLIWARGLRAKWMKRKAALRRLREQQQAAARVSRFVQNRGGHRQRFIAEAARRGLRVRVERTSIFVEDVFVYVRRNNGRRYRQDFLRPEHPGYIHSLSRGKALNVIALPDGRWVFSLDLRRPGVHRYVNLRADELQTEWPSPAEWRDMALALADSMEVPTA